MIHSSKWLKISEKLKGRSSHSVKNRFHSLLAKDRVIKDHDILKKAAKKLLESLKFKKPLKKIHSENHQNNITNHNFGGINNYFHHKNGINFFIFLFNCFN